MKTEVEILPTVKENIEFSYELYGSNENAENEIQDTFGFYTIKDYLSVPSQAHERKREPKDKPKKKEPEVRRVKFVNEANNR